MIREDVDVEAFAYKMLLNNRVEGVLSYEFREGGIYYSPENFVSLDTYLKERISGRQILDLLVNINYGLAQLNKYMLGVEDVNENLDLIFIGGDKNIYFTVNFKGDSSYKSIFDKIRNKASLIIDGCEDRLIMINNSLLENENNIELINNILAENDSERKTFKEKIEKEEVREKKTDLKVWKSKLFKYKKAKNQPYKEKNLNFDFKIPKF